MACPTKRRRRTRAQVDTIKAGLVEILAAEHPMSVRQLFYAAEVRGLIEKTEADYKQTVCRLTLELRRDGTIPYEWITDGTRWVRRPDTSGDMKEALEEMARYYRRSLWVDAPARVEVWLEKEALAGVVYPTTDLYDVPLMVCRGFASASYLYTTAQDIRQAGRPTYIYHFGDLDP